MKAKNISGQAPGGKRKKLAEVLPLNTPFMIEIYPMHACNFTCKYCMMSVKKEERNFISDKIIMDFGLYKKCINDIVLFPDKLKILRFSGIGEPLLHKNIADMVEYAALKNITNDIEILTNASLLTPEMSDSLISAGLSRLIVSLQGTTKEKYKEVSGVDIDFENFVENLRYFFDNKKKNTKLYIKIVDEALENKEDEERFYKLFGDICDIIAIEHIVPIQPNVDYGKVLKGEDKSVTQFGLPASDVLVCPQPFFTLRINTDGKVIPCYSYEFPGFVGDCNNQSVSEIWNGKEFQGFRCKMLDGIKNVGEICAKCKIVKHRLFPEDVITINDAERLKKYYE
ncbi:radical SAM protein [Patescibacteria group bacterium]|nr:radical SAM protein [Patescibacteria group bacterium]